MQEGWCDNDYIILYDSNLAGQVAAKYELHRFLGGYSLIGLRGWDDFIVAAPDRKTYTIPTIPIDLRHLTPFDVPSPQLLKVDHRFTGRIKWYVQPLVFGGDGGAEDNLVWLNQEQHAKAVVYWNNLYQEHISRGENQPAQE